MDSHFFTLERNIRYNREYCQSIYGLDEKNKNQTHLQSQLLTFTQGLKFTVTFPAGDIQRLAKKCVCGREKFLPALA